MDDLQQRISEAKRAQFAIRFLWPLQKPIARLLLGRPFFKRCSKCILSERAAKIDSQTGVCEFCAAPPSAIDVKFWSSLKPEMDRLISKTISENPDAKFHGLLLFSGGKDSCYMLQRLGAEFPQMRLLCLSVDNTFTSPFAVKNVNESVKKMGCSHVWVRIPNKMAEGMFRFALKRKNQSDPMGLIDFIDGELISDIARSFASSLGIPMIFMGLSCEQVERILNLKSFEHPVEKESEGRKSIRNLSLTDVIEPQYLSWWWNGASENKKAARFIFPLATWNVSEDEIKMQVDQAGMLKGAQLDPMLTNHDMILPMIIKDYADTGYFTYEPEIAQKVREGRAKRADWIQLFEFLEFASATGVGLPKAFRETLKRLNLTEKEIRGV